MKIIVWTAFVVGVGCRSAPVTPVTPPQPPEPKPTPQVLVPDDDGGLTHIRPTTPPQAACGNGNSMTVKFYDAGQALAALVTLPDGQHILVDTGESPKAKKAWHQRVLEGLEADIGAGGKIDMLWVTHQHSDHLGGVPGVMAKFEVAHYVHNGTKPDDAPDVYTNAMKAAKKEADMTVIAPGQTTVPITTGEDVTLTAIVPDQWPGKCGGHPNDCSILLRIDYCASSVLFTGDAEIREEKVLDVKSATLLQVGHHGSDTSSGPEFLAKVEPSYAVMSPGLPFEASNTRYCHPIREAIEALNAQMGGIGSKTIHAFNGTKYGPSCKASKKNIDDWSDVPANDNIYVTSRDGAVTFTTTGDGQFSVVTER